jgi:glycosyltransferase involved in cell wall biosynthesis
VDERRLSQAYYGTDVDDFRTERTGHLRSVLGVGDDVPVVGMVALMYRPKRYLGHRHGIKGHEDLITAVARFLPRSRSLVVAFVGGPWLGAESYEKRVRRFAAVSGDSRLRFLGMRSDVPALYPDMNLAVHPSLSENVGGSLESLLCGVPTVATSVGGIPELVVNGVTGWLVPPRNPRVLAGAIEEALDDESVAAGRAARGRELARERFDVRRTAADVAKIYQAALSSESTSPAAGLVGAGGP